MPLCWGRENKAWSPGICLQCCWGGGGEVRSSFPALLSVPFLPSPSCPFYPFCSPIHPLPSLLLPLLPHFHLSPPICSVLSLNWQNGFHCALSCLGIGSAACSAQQAARNFSQLCPAFLLLRDKPDATTRGVFRWDFGTAAGPSRTCAELMNVEFSWKAGIKAPSAWACGTAACAPCSASCSPPVPFLGITISPKIPAASAGPGKACPRLSLRCTVLWPFLPKLQPGISPPGLVLWPQPPASTTPGGWGRSAPIACCVPPGPRSSWRRASTARGI